MLLHTVCPHEMYSHYFFFLSFTPSQSEWIALATIGGEESCIRKENCLLSSSRREMEIESFPSQQSWSFDLQHTQLTAMKALLIRLMRDLADSSERENARSGDIDEVQ